MNYSWEFAVKRRGDRGNSGEDPSLKQFRDFNNRCLIREFAQNSIDAHSEHKGAEPVEIHFSYKEIGGTLKKQLINNLYEHVLACQKASMRTGFNKNSFDRKVEYVTNHLDKPIICLKISDYNTTGMDYFDEELWDTEEEYMSHKQPPFNSCVISDGASNKPTGNAGGSHGQGKNAGFEKSEIDAVYYSTMTEPFDEQGNHVPSKTFGEGVIQLCDHRIFEGPSKGSYLKDGYFGSKEGSIPDEGDDIPEEFRRIVPGTDAYIIGVYESEEDVKEIKQYMLRSFFTAILNKVVVFNLFGEEFNSENLIDKIEKYFPVEEYTNYDKVWQHYRINFNPRPYCLKALCQEKDDISFFVRYAEHEAYPYLDHATLHIWKDESIRLNTKHNDTILCMRNNGMVIEVYRPTTKHGLCGVLICDGEGAKYLRLMENVTHDSWTVAQLKDAKKEEADIAKKVQAEMYSFIADVTDELFPQHEGEDKPVPGLNEIMGSAGNNMKSDNGASTAAQGNAEIGLLDFTTTTEGFQPKEQKGLKVGSIVSRTAGGINRRVKNQMTGQKLPTKRKEETEKEGKKQEHQRQNENNKKNEKEKDISGTHPSEGAVDVNVKGSHSTVIAALFKQRSIHSDYGIIHRLCVRVFEDYDYCSMVIKLADMNNGTPIKVKSVSRSEYGKQPDVTYNDDFIIEGLFGNSVRGFALTKGDNYFDVKFDDELDHSLMITAYENK